MAKREISRRFEVKDGRNWTETYCTDDRARVYEDLAHELLNLKVFKYRQYTRMTQRPNYDGTRTIEIYQKLGVNDIVTGRSVYIIDA